MEREREKAWYAIAITLSFLDTIPAVHTTSHVLRGFDDGLGVAVQIEGAVLGQRVVHRTAVRRAVIHRCWVPSGSTWQWKSTIYGHHFPGFPHKIW